MHRNERALSPHKSHRLVASKQKGALPLGEGGNDPDAFENTKIWGLKQGNLSLASILVWSEILGTKEEEKEFGVLCAPP